MFDLFTSEQDFGQQLEQVTLDMVLDREEEYNVCLAEVNLSEKSGLMVLETFQTMRPGGLWSWKTCRLTCCATKYVVSRMVRSHVPRFLLLGPPA